MITEKQQKIVDAVNYLKANVKNIMCSQIERSAVCNVYKTNYRSYITMPEDAVNVSEFICTIKEFNQCVNEMSLNGYRQSYLDSYLANTKQLLTKENSYSYFQKENKMFKKYEKVMANGSEYLFGCINPVYDKFCILFDADGKYCHAHIMEVKAKPKTKNVYFVFDKQGLYIDHFQKFRPILSDELEYQIFEIEVNI